MYENNQEDSIIRQVIEKEQAGMLTDGGIDKYVEDFGMTRQEFLEWLATKERVLDLGAGGGLLKKQLDVLKEKGLFSGKTEVVSFDIKYAIPEGRRQADNVNYLAFSGTGSYASRLESKKVGESFRKTAIAGTYLHLPFSNDFFDGVVACRSFGLWTAGRDQLLGAFKEVDRVLDKKRGSGFITVAGGSSEHTIGAMEGSLFISLPITEITFLKPQFRTVTKVDNLGQRTQMNFITIQR